MCKVNGRVSHHYVCYRDACIIRVFFTVYVCLGLKVGSLLKMWFLLWYVGFFQYQATLLVCIQKCIVCSFRSVSRVLYVDNSYLCYGMGKITRLYTHDKAL